MLRAAQKYGTVIFLILSLTSCARWNFVRKFKALLERDQFLNQRYISFEDSLPNDRHWSENVGTLNEIVQKKSEILDQLGKIKPPNDYKATYDLFTQDLIHSIDYLKKEMELTQKNVEYGSWLARSMLKGSIGHDISEAGLNKSKEEILRIQDEVTMNAGKCNFSQERLKQDVLAKEIARRFDAITYPSYKKGYIGFKIK